VGEARRAGGRRIVVVQCRCERGSRARRTRRVPRSRPIDVGPIIGATGFRPSAVGEGRDGQDRAHGLRVSGVLHVQMKDGEGFEVGPGAVTYLPSGHDARVVGDEVVTVIDWHGSKHYAER
jgi:hypothetical protein